MAVAYESDGGTVFAAAGANTAITVPLPATRPVGSVLLFVGWCRLITATVSTAPTGYTLLSTFTSGTASGGRIWVYAKEVVGGETAPTFATTGATGTSGDLWGACIFCYSGVDLSGGISAIYDGTPTTTDASGTTTCTYPALTISNAASMVVRFLARFRDAADTFTFTATWNEREDLGSTTRLGGQFHLQDKLATGSGSQAAVTVAPSNTTAARYLAATLALKPVAAVDHSQPVADTLALADSATTARGVAQPIADTLSLADLLTAESGTGVSLADTLTLADSLSSQSAITRAIADTLALTDAIRFERALTFTETLALADLLATARTISQAIADTLSPADALVVQSAFLRALADTLTLDDLTTPVLGGSVTDWTQPIADTLTLADSFALERVLALADAVVLVDQVLASALAGGTVLNAADAVCLGGEPVDRIYAGATQVWP